MGADTDTRRPEQGADRARRLVLLLAALAVASPCCAASHRRHPVRSGWSDGVVRCVALSASSRHRHHHPAAAAAARGGALPTNRAVFFARSGDRCLWRHGVLGRG